MRSCSFVRSLHRQSSARGRCSESSSASFHAHRRLKKHGHPYIRARKPIYKSQSLFLLAREKAVEANEVARTPTPKAPVIGADVHTPITSIPLRTAADTSASRVGDTGRASIGYQRDVFARKAARRQAHRPVRVPLNLWFETVRPRNPSSESSFLVRVDPPAAMMSTSSSVRGARSVISSRLPIGVATTYSFPGIVILP